MDCCANKCHNPAIQYAYKHACYMYINPLAQQIPQLKLWAPHTLAPSIQSTFCSQLFESSSTQSTLLQKRQINFIAEDNFH